MGQKHARNRVPADMRLNEATQEQKTDDIFPGEAKKQLFYAVEHLDTEPKGD